MYGYVMDHCPDQNFWCQNDAYHLDISRPYLTGMGLTGPHIWNGRKVHWSYIDDVPGGYACPPFLAPRLPPGAASQTLLQSSVCEYSSGCPQLHRESYSRPAHVV